MRRREGAAPHSAREVWALVMLLLMTWFPVAVAVIAIGGLSDVRAVALVAAGALVILGAGFGWARRFPRH